MTLLRRGNPGRDARPLGLQRCTETKELVSEGQPLIGVGIFCFFDYVTVMNINYQISIL